MSATTLSALAAADVRPEEAVAADALPDGVRVFRGILIGGVVSCGLWAGIVAAVMAII